MGTHGWSKVDCTTEWFYMSLSVWGTTMESCDHTFGLNWNWTRSPAAATTLLGEKISVPLGPPTLTTCVTTIPSAAGATPVEDSTAPVDKLPTADAVADARRAASDAIMWFVAAAKPMRADAITDRVKYMLICVGFFVRDRTV
jgi:hypothetical protein